MADEDVPHLTFFGDSSSRDSDYMVAGGFAVSGHRISEIDAKIADIRGAYGISSEFHWGEYRGGRRAQAYRELVDYGLGLIAAKQAALHVIITPFKDYNHKAKKGENRDTSVNRMYYQICLHRLARFYGKRRAVHIRLDAGNDSADICRMREQLCADAFKKFKTPPNCIRSIEPVNSTNAGIIQMADVFVGAIAAKQNNITHTSPKGDLAEYVMKAAGRTSWASGTPMNARFMTVWHFKGNGAGPSQP